MIKVMWAMGAMATLGVAAFACSSKSGSGGQTFSGPSCPSGATGSSSGTQNSACTSCIQTHCASADSCVDTACNAYFTCFCACAEGDETCYMGCPQSTDCTSCISNTGSCELSNCGSECGLSSSSSGSSGGGTPTGQCATLATCCSAQPASVQPSCNQLADLNDQMACQEELEGGLCN